MNIYEKIFSLLAVFFTSSLILSLLFIPEMQQFDRLLPACMIGLTVNVGMMFLIMRDILVRHFANPNSKYVWLALVIFVWPSTLFYLFRYGFRPR